MSFDINITGIEAFGKHGIYEIEKNNEQRFLIDIFLTLDNLKDDNIINTINYEDLVDDSISLVQTQSFDLIETLSKKIAEHIIKKYSNLRFSNLKYIKITVHKPETSLSDRTENISVIYNEQLK
ncbi:MAG: dihydroneopterin aldolase [Candidatus Actinomarina sp.]|tara:strand:+ start:3824 stop:4195 length:372 start_codon:yes stop_codon:yes gene_type:complete